MYYLSDISTANFARKKGSKDKQPRNRLSVGKGAGIGALAGGTYLGVKTAAMLHHLSPEMIQELGGPNAHGINPAVLKYGAIGLNTTIGAGLGAGIGAGQAYVRNKLRDRRDKQLSRKIKY